MEDTRQPCSIASASCQCEHPVPVPSRNGDHTYTMYEYHQCSSRRHSYAASFFGPLLDSRIGLVAGLLALPPMSYWRMSLLECHLLRLLRLEVVDPFLDYLENLC